MEKKTMHTEAVRIEDRTFYFDIKKSARGTNYVVIACIGKKSGDELERHQILIFENELDQFGFAFMRSLIQMNNADGEKAQSSKVGSRMIYFDLKTSKQDQEYLTITTLKTKEGEEERRSILVFQSEAEQFSEALVRTLIHFNATADSRNQRVEEAKKKYPNAYEPWTKKDEADLALLYSEGKTTEELVERFQRQPSAIVSRIEKLGLVKAGVAA